MTRCSPHNILHIMEKDTIFETAERYIRYTGKSVYLTGKAGTGKTTFLKYITQSISKRYVILAPTGVAAINAGGTTIHSFFQLPLCPYLPDVKELVTEYQMPEKYRRPRKERVKLIRTLELLVIDEISMVRADILDAVDMTLRSIRRNEKPFGGVQLLMIGDAQQLSPVVKEEERRYMEQVYPSPYFFHSKALKELDYTTIELQKIHRQKDETFLEILNSIRENRITDNILKRLNSRVNAFSSDDDTIRLTTHNRQAENVNTAKLESLPGKPSIFNASIEGDFPEKNYPTDKELALKEGAQIMFIRNDAEGRFYNGKIGIVKSISKDHGIIVGVKGENPIHVEPVVWENIEYALDKETGEITPNVIGTFRQLPVRIAWAVTIHKSQGLTFDKVIIDAGAAFAFGQVYVALSRCRTLEGISLGTPISKSAIYTDSNIAHFNATQPSLESVQNAFEAEARKHSFTLIKELFGIKDAAKAMATYMRAWRGVMESLYPKEFNELLQQMAKTEELEQTGERFKQQLEKIENDPDDNTLFLQERVRKASEYYLPIIDSARECCIRLSRLETDNKAVKKRLKESGEELLAQLEIVCSTLKAIIANGFSAEEYSRIRTECMLDDQIKGRKKQKKATVPPDSTSSPSTTNELLRERLQQWRTERFKADNVPAYTIMHQSTLLEIASRVPKSMTELLSIKGLGKAKCRKYGEEILKITSEF